MLEAPLGQARAAPVELVLQHRREGVQEGLLGALGLHDAGAQGGGDARQAQFAQGAFDLLHVHGLISVMVVFGVPVSGCAAPLLDYSTDVPALQLRVVGQPGVEDGRARFREMFCTLLSTASSDQANVDCDRYLVRLADEPPATRPAPVPQTATPTC